MRIPDEVISMLDAAEIEGCSLRLTGQIERKLYLDTNKVLELLGGKWNKNAKAHLFDYDPAEAINMAVLTGNVDRKADPRREFGFFETPHPVVDRLIDLADIQHGDYVLEPSAGRGAIARRLPSTGLALCELDDGRNDELTERFGGAKMLKEKDFLRVCGQWDRIIANPPFGGAQRDVDHVRHMWDCLAPGGVLVSVMARGISFRTNRKTTELRSLIEKHGEIIPLPERSFRESGTDMSTCIVRMAKG